MAYLFLALAISFEVMATSFLKVSAGFTRLFPTLLCMAFYTASFYSLSRALQRIDLGIAYATWCAAGIMATAMISYFVFHERLSTAGIFGMGLIVAGCVIVNAFGKV